MRHILGGAGFGACRQLGRTDAEALGEPNDIAPARIAAAALDVTDPALREAGRSGELHLTDAALITDGANGAPEGGGIRCGGHG